MQELKSGDRVKAKSGGVYIVRRVSKPRRDTGYCEPLFRLENGVLGNREWTQEELVAAGITIIEGETA